MPISFSSVWLTLASGARPARPAPAAPAPRAPSASGSTRPGRPSAPDRRRSARPSTARAGCVLPSPDSLSMFWRTDAQQRLDLERAPRRPRPRCARCARGSTGCSDDEALDARAAEPLDQHLEAALGQLAHAHDHADRAGAVERCGFGSSSLGSRCATRKQRRSSDSSALATASIEIGRVTRSGTIM